MANEIVNYPDVSWPEVVNAALGYKNGITEDHLSASVQEKLNRESGGGDTKPAGSDVWEPPHAIIVKEDKPMKKTVKIEGMMCQMCVKHVKNALSPLDPEVEVSLENKCAMIDEGVDNAAIAAAVKEAGYEVVG